MSTFFRRLLKIAGLTVGALLLVLAAGALYVDRAGIPRYPVERVDFVAPATPERLARGKKLATLSCAGCHLDPTTRRLTGKRMVDAPPQFGVIYSSNITRSRDKGIGAWSDGEIAYLLRTGVARDGRYLPPWMVKLPHMAEDDLAAIVAFLRSDDPLVAAAEVDAPGISQPTFLTKLLCRIAFKKLPYPSRPILARRRATRSRTAAT